MGLRSIDEIRRGYKNKDLSPVEVTELFIKRIENQKDLNAYITICPERALEQAKIAEQKMMLENAALGVLEGIPISYKDLIHTKNIRTTSGSLIYKDFIPSTNAKVVDRLESEGAINLGKTNLPEFTYAITCNNPHYGPTKNPWNRQFSPGGSSGGSAVAVAANLSMASIGTDTGGSIRIPAASCGIIGLKPTYGYVDKTGVRKNAWTLDHVGPLTKNMVDLAIMMEALTGHQYKSHCTNDIRGLRVGVPKNYFNEFIDEEVYKLYLKSLEKFEEMGAILIEVDVPLTEADTHQLLTVSSSESGYINKENVVKHTDKMGPYIRSLIEPARSITAFEYIEGLERKKQITKDFEKIFENINILATPTLPTTPKETGIDKDIILDGEEKDLMEHMIRFVSVFNFTEQPALSIPCGLTSAGLPVGLQLIANPYQEAILIKAGYAFEQGYLSDFYKERDLVCETYLGLSI